jgi:predicted nucleic acid-binding protein
MPSFLPDTTCLIAAVCSWHEHHERTVKEIERRLRQGDSMIIAAPALVEAYAVLTRLPPPHRLSPSDAITLLDANFMRGVKVIALDERSYRKLLRQAPNLGIAGGRAYDAVIASCAVKGKARVVLTFNERDFLPFTEDEIEVVVPD